MPKKPKHPCSKTCEERKAGCASTCAAWKSYVQVRDEFYAERHMIKEEYELARDQAIKRHVRRMKEGFD